MNDTNAPPPVAIPAGAPSPAPADRPHGAALCLSGGGFRATLFHLGALRRLNELGTLSSLAVITSVSGGSILNGVLASRWERLAAGPNGTYAGFDEHVAKPVRAFCGRDLRTAVLVGSRLDFANLGGLIRDRFSVSARHLVKEYGKLLLNRTLGGLPTPGPGTPRFVFCASSMQSGACWHFHGGPASRMGDFYSGYMDGRAVTLAEAVAASSAFPPGFAPLRLAVPPEPKRSRVDPWGVTRPRSWKRPSALERTHTEAVLTDGGVYDNLGVEPVWDKCDPIFVSDAGRPFRSAGAAGPGFASRLSRAFDISANQVGAVRRRWFVARQNGTDRRGALWMIDTDVRDFPVQDARGYKRSVLRRLADVRTDLNAFTAGEIACLENHGYAMADAAMRSRAAAHCPNLGAPFVWPHPAWFDDAAAAAALRTSDRRKLFRDVWAYLSRR